MRARQGRVLGWLAVLAYSGLLVGVTLTAMDDHGRRPAAALAQPVEDAAERFVRAWERSREVTFVSSGTYERHSRVTEASIASEDVVAQRPPRRLHRQLGGIEGRDDDRRLVCPGPRAGDEPDRTACRLGSPGGPTYAESVASEVAGLRSLTQGPAPLYTVADGAPGCFDLDLVRIDPRAPFGVAASFCFDAATGAPAGNRVQHAGGIVEVVVVTDIRTDVTDADLTP